MKGRKVLEQALKRIGEEEGKGAKIVFGQLGGPVGKANPVTNTITLDLSRIDKYANDNRFTPEDRDAFFAGTVAHEGGHLPGRILMMPKFHQIGKERHALFTESVFYQGLGRNDPQGYLWNKDWLLVDRSVLEQIRSKEIERYMKKLGETK